MGLFLMEAEPRATEVNLISDYHLSVYWSCGEHFRDIHSIVMLEAHIERHIIATLLMIGG